MRCLIRLTLIAAVHSPISASAQPPTTGPEIQMAARIDPAAWREDVHVLVQTLADKHVDAFTKVSREQFDAAVKDLDGRIDVLTDWQMYLECRRLVAMVGDAHTSLGDGKGRFVNHYYPFSVLLLGDGVYITATTQAQRSLLGMKITRIGSVSIDEAIQRMGAIISHENDSWLRNQVRMWLMSADALAFVGLVDDPERASFTLADATGKQVTVTLSPIFRRASRILPVWKK